MRRYYSPSNNEIKIIDNVEKQLKSIAKNTFGMKDPFIDFAYQDGLQYSRIHENKDIAAVLRSLQAEDIHIRVMVQNGVVVYYKYKGEKIYVAKHKDIVKAADIKIRHGKWVTEFDDIQQERPKRKKKKRSKDSLDSLYERPNYYRQPVQQQESQPTENFYDTKYERYLRRKEYCQQYREMFGTESTEVTDEYYFFGDF